MAAEEADEEVQPSLVIYDDDKNAFWAVGVKSFLGRRRQEQECDRAFGQALQEHPRPEWL